MTHLVIFIISILLPSLALAQSGDIVYKPSVEIPGISSDLSIESYMQALYLLAISVAAIMAVIKITIAGVKYMLSDVVTNKESAKKDIQGALFGLLIVLAAVLILETINPQLTQLDALQTGFTGAPSAIAPRSGGSSGGTSADTSSFIRCTPGYIYSIRTGVCETIHDNPDSINDLTAQLKTLDAEIKDLGGEATESMKQEAEQMRKQLDAAVKQATSGYGGASSSGGGNVICSSVPVFHSHENTCPNGCSQVPAGDRGGSQVYRCI